MASSIVKDRTNDISKTKTIRIREQLNTRSIPEDRGIKAMKEASRIAEERGISNMSLEEINAEINAVRNR
jgi:hypothetical protein